MKVGAHNTLGKKKFSPLTRALLLRLAKGGPTTEGGSLSSNLGAGQEKSGLLSVENWKS